MIINGRFLLQDISGVQRVAREMLHHLDELLFEQGAISATLVIPAVGHIIDPPALKAIQICRTGRVSGHLWEQTVLPRLAKGQTLLTLGNTAPALSLLTPHTQVITLIHDLSFIYFPKAYSRKFRMVYTLLTPLIFRYAAHVITVSQSEETQLKRHYRRARPITFLQNGGLPDDNAEGLSQNKIPGFAERRGGLYVGSLSRRKNAHGVIRAATDFLRRNPEELFEMIGASSASFAALGATIAADIADRLILHGQMNDQHQIHQAYRRARFLLFPSYYEASPLPPIEAMGLGCPVITSPINAMRERCGDAALYCAPDDQTALARLMQVLTDDAQTWTAHSKAGLQQAGQFSWRRQAEGVLNICKAVA